MRYCRTERARGNSSSFCAHSKTRGIRTKPPPGPGRATPGALLKRGSRYPAPRLGGCRRRRAPIWTPVRATAPGRPRAGQTAPARPRAGHPRGDALKPRSGFAAPGLAGTIAQNAAATQTQPRRPRQWPSSRGQAPPRWARACGKRTTDRATAVARPPRENALAVAPACQGGAPAARLLQAAGAGLRAKRARGKDSTEKATAVALLPRNTETSAGRPHGPLPPWAA